MICKHTLKLNVEAEPQRGLIKEHTERSKAGPVGIQPLELEQPCAFIKNKLRLRLQNAFLRVLWGMCL